MLVTDTLVNIFDCFKKCLFEPERFNIFFVIACTDAIPNCSNYAATCDTATIPQAAYNLVCPKQCGSCSSSKFNLVYLNS